MTGKKKALTAFSIFLLLMVGSVGALQITGSININEDLDEWFIGPHDLIDSDNNWACTTLTGYILPNCQPVIGVDPGGATDSEVHTSIINAALAAVDNREQVLGSVRTRLNASYGVAMAKAKVDAMIDLNEGRAESIARSNASDAVRDYYTQIQSNILSYRNRHALKINASINEVERTSGLSYSDIFRVKLNHNPGANANGIRLSYDTPQDMRVKAFNVTLYDGSNMTIYQPQAYIVVDTYSGYGCSKSLVREWVNLTEKIQFQHYGTNSACTLENSKTTYSGFKVVDLEGNTSFYLDPTTYASTINEVEDTRIRAISNVETIVNDIYGKYAGGEINISKSLGPLEVLKTASTSYQSTGYFDYATLTAKQMGLNTNGTFAFTVEWSPEGVNKTYKDTGQLFLADGAFNSTIKAGKQYNVSDQTVWLTRKNDAGKIVQEDLNGTFTVTQMTNKKTGETVTKTSVQDIKVYDANVSDLKQQFDKLREQLEEYKAETGGGAGGGFSLGSFFSSPAGIGTSILILVFLGLLAFIAGGVTT